MQIRKWNRTMGEESLLRETLLHDDNENIKIQGNSKKTVFQENKRKKN